MLKEYLASRNISTSFSNGEITHHWPTGQKNTIQELETLDGFLLTELLPTGDVWYQYFYPDGTFHHQKISSYNLN